MKPESTSSTPMSWGLLLLMIAWGALAGAHAELATRALLYVTRPVLESNFHLNPLAIGIGPLVNLPIVSLAVLAAWLVARVARPAKTFEFVFFAVAALAAYEVALVTQRVHAGALALLAAGMASVVTRVAARFPTWTIRLIASSTVLMAIAAITGSAWLVRQPDAGEQQALTAFPAAPSGSPNVLILILDTVRAIELGMYGNVTNTSPSLDSLARNAIRFDHAWSTAPWTLPSHTTMLSGRYAHELTADWTTPYGGEHRLLSELLQERGYATSAFVGNLTYLNSRWGLDRGFGRYEDYQVDETVLWSTSSLGKRLVDLVNTPSRHRVLANGTSARLIRERFSAWQRSVGDRPFFAFVNFFDAHAPYGAPAPYDTMFLGRRPRFYDIDNWRQRDSVELAELRAAYQQSIAWLDSQIGALIADLRQQGVLERTLVIVTSDHGESFGEHGYSGHGASLHSPQLHVPLVILPPGWRSPHVVDADVSLRDIAATVAEFTGLAENSIPGNSLARYWAQDTGTTKTAILAEVTGRPDVKPWYPSSKGSLQAIVEGRMGYVRQTTGSEWLFDLARDPLEQENLAERPEFRDRLATLRAALLAARGDSAQTR